MNGLCSHFSHFCGSTDDLVRLNGVLHSLYWPCDFFLCVQMRKQSSARWSVQSRFRQLIRQTTHESANVRLQALVHLRQLIALHCDSLLVGSTFTQ